MPADKTPVNILLLVTGSIAAVKVGLLLDQLSSKPYRIRIAATKSAFHFLNRMQKSAHEVCLNQILTDDHEWREWQEMNDAVMHIELRRWAHFVVIAPLDANTLAKLANGLCDNLVTCVMRAWEVKQKPVILCPAMNTAMWTHPVTAQQLNTLQGWYADRGPCDAPRTEGELPATLKDAMFQIVHPVKKRLACGDVGVGGMALVEDIARVIENTANLVCGCFDAITTNNTTTITTEATAEEKAERKKNALEDAEEK